VTSALLAVRDLRTSFFLEGGEARAVDGVSFSLDAGRVLGLVGESGCGKSVTALSLMRLVPPPGRIVAGEVRFDGRDLLPIAEAEMRTVRGAGIAMVFQEPMTSLNPVFTVGNQIAEAVRLHRPVSRREAWARAVELLGEVGIPDPATRAGAYPHQLSGGMRQRVMIAMAISCEPRVLIADEPTTALDVTIQAQILALIKRLRAETGTGLLLITHDMGVVADMADRICVMYAGRIVEEGDVFSLFRRQHHPYTRLLLKSLPPVGGERRRSLSTIEGVVPDLRSWPAGCRFHPRCPIADDFCRNEAPPLANIVETQQRAACWHTDRIAELDAR